MTSSISGFPFFSFHIPHIPHIPEIFDLGKFDLGIPDIPHIPHIPELFDLGIFPIFIFPFDLGIPEIFDLGIFAHFFLVGFSAHFVPIPPFPILLRFVTSLNFYRPRVNNNYGAATFSFVASKLWETIPSDLKILSYTHFYKQYKLFLLNAQSVS